MSTTSRSGKIVQKLGRRFRRAGAVSREHLKENIVQRTGSFREVRLQVIEWLMLMTAIIALAVIQIFWHIGAYSTTTFAPGGTYTEGTMGAVNSMNPLYAITDSEKALGRLLFRNLVGYDTDGHVQMDIAQSVVPSADGKAWTITLRDNLYWSDGEAVDTADLFWTFNTIKSAESRTVYADIFTGVSLEVKSEREAVFTLPTAYAGFVSTLHFPLLPEHILRDVPPSELYNHAFSFSPIGSGQFVYDNTQKLAADTEQKITLRPSQHALPTTVSYFVVHTYLNSENLERAMERLSISGSANLASGYQPANASINTRETSVQRGVFAYLNTDSEAMKNLKIRQALQLALDTNALRGQLSQSYPLSQPFNFTGLDLKYPVLPQPDFEAAQKLLAGIDPAKVGEIVIVSSDSQLFIDTAQAIADTLTELGFTATAIAADQQTLILSYIRPRAYDILVYETDIVADTDPFAYYHSSMATESGYNFSNYTNPLVDDALLKARRTLDPKVRQDKYNYFFARWAADVPVIPLYQSSVRYHYVKTARPFAEDVQLVSALDRFNDVDRWAVNHDQRLRTP
jgi:peptide/nickel transport system substrate-binding protein